MNAVRSCLTNWKVLTFWCAIVVGFEDVPKPSFP